MKGDDRAYQPAPDASQKPDTHARRIISSDDRIPAMIRRVAYALMFAGWAGIHGAVILLYPDNASRPAWLTAAGIALLICVLTALFGGGMLGMADETWRNKAAAVHRRFTHRRRRRRKRRTAHQNQ